MFVMKKAGMTLKITKEVKVGIAFIIALSVLIWGLMYLKGLEIFQPKKVVFAVYDRVNGLVVANPVTIKGMNVGQVKSIYFSKKELGKIVVELVITQDFPIPKNSIAKIYSSGLISSKEVEIVLGDSQNVLQDGDTLKAQTESSLTDEVGKQLIPLKEKAERLINSIDTVANLVKDILNKRTQENLAKAVENINVVTRNLASITGGLDTLVGKQKTHLASIIGNVESISKNLKQNNENISNILVNFSNLSDSLSKARIPATIDKVNTALQDINLVLAKINNGQGSIGLLLNDKNLYNEVAKAAKDLNLLLEDIKANPSKYIKVSVF
jgi:phospholipid/cholesterol/gamma-HCH transport system substrate-binding protein